MKRSILFFLSAVVLAAQCGAEPAPAAGGGTVYKRVYDALAALPERRVGSENYAKAFDAVEAELKAAGPGPATADR